MKYEGRLLNLGTIDKCNRKFAENCKIAFPEKVPVTYNFQSGVDKVLGNAEIFEDYIGLNCRVSLNHQDFTADEYYIGGYYRDIEKHNDGNITVIDSCRLMSISIVPDHYCCDKNLKIWKAEV